MISLITQVRVDKNDPSFQKPSKPIGPFMIKKKRKQRWLKPGCLSRRCRTGLPKVVPSPMPQEIVEKDVIKTLVDAGVITICAGGGGVPVYQENQHYVGVEAVNDKDFAAKVLADNVQADRLIILTVLIISTLTTINQTNKLLKEITVEQAEQYIEEGHFAAGSMLPKIQAAIGFVNEDASRTAIITSIENLAVLDQQVGLYPQIKRDAR